MLRIEPTNDKELLDRLSRAIFDADFDGNVGFVLYLDDDAIGVCRAIITPVKSAIDFIGVLPESRKKGYGDFFTRVMLDNLTRVSEKVAINYESEYYLKFGFRQHKGTMEITSADIVFPSECKHSHN